MNTSLPSKAFEKRGNNSKICSDFDLKAQASIAFCPGAHLFNVSAFLLKNYPISRLASHIVRRRARPARVRLLGNGLCGYRLQALGFRHLGNADFCGQIGSRVEGRGSRVNGPGSRVQGPGSRVQGIFVFHVARYCPSRCSNKSTRQR